MKIFKIILDMMIEPYRNLPYKQILSVFYTTFALWCFNLGVLCVCLFMMPLLLSYPEQLFEAWWKVISNWFTSPFQLYYLWFCFIWAIILEFSE